MQKNQKQKTHIQSFFKAVKYNFFDKLQGKIPPSQQIKQKFNPQKKKLLIINKHPQQYRTTKNKMKSIGVSTENFAFNKNLLGKIKYKFEKQSNQLTLQNKKYKKLQSSFSSVHHNIKTIKQKVDYQFPLKLPIKSHSLLNFSTTKSQSIQTQSSPQKNLEYKKKSDQLSNKLYSSTKTIKLIKQNENSTISSFSSNKQITKQQPKDKSKDNRVKLRFSILKMQLQKKLQI